MGRIQSRNLVARDGNKRPSSWQLRCQVGVGVGTRLEVGRNVNDEFTKRIRLEIMLLGRSSSAKHIWGG